MQKRKLRLLENGLCLLEACNFCEAYGTVKGILESMQKKIEIQATR